MIVHDGPEGLIEDWMVELSGIEWEGSHGFECRRVDKD